MKEQKKGISLIVLVITIIVMLILASAVIITLSNSSIINKAKEAVNKTDVKNFDQELSLALADMKLKDASYGLDEANAATVRDIKKYIPDFTDKYYGKLIVQNGKLAYVKGNVTEEEKLMFESIGVEAGSYITVAKAEEIKALAEEATIDELVSSTEVTTYIGDMPAEYAHLFTIYQGKLYYRYEKATHGERVSLHAAGIPFLIGDVNGDGTLTQEDVDIIVNYNSTGNAPEYKYFMCVSDVNYDGYTDGPDVTGLADIVRNNKVQNYIDLDKEDPLRTRLVDEWQKENAFMLLDESLTTANPKEIVKYCSQYGEISLEEARRVSVVQGLPYFRYEKLSQKEREYAIELEYGYLIGDGNFDGYVDEKDKELITKYVQSEITLTDEQRAVLDLDPNGVIDSTDEGFLAQYFAGTLTYEDVFWEYLERLANSN